MTSMACSTCHVCKGTKGVRAGSHGKGDGSRGGERWHASHPSGQTNGMVPMITIIDSVPSALMKVQFSRTESGHSGSPFAALYSQ